MIAFLAADLLLAVLGLMDIRILGAISIGGGAVALVGFLDDRAHLRTSVRLSVHLAAALWVVFLLGGLPEGTLVNWGLHGIWTGRLIAVLVIVWITNLFNFMDGLDGIAGGEAVFVSGAGAWLNSYRGGPAGLTAVMVCLAAASLGFLRWNWPPARIFMGDVGSGFLGFSLGVVSLVATKEGVFPFEVWAILGGVFFVDATVTLIRRIVRGDKWFEAHRTHAYQHLARRWKAHLPVTISIIAIDLFWLLPMAILTTRFPSYAVWLFAAASAPLAVLVVACGGGAERG